MAKTQEYLRLNYPADIRRNLKGLNLPEDSKATSENNLDAAKNSKKIDVTKTEAGKAEEVVKGGEKKKGNINSKRGGKRDPVIISRMSA